VLRVSDEVSSALRDGKPVVALESAIITHGMPYPVNIQCESSFLSAYSLFACIISRAAEINDQDFSWHLLMGKRLARFDGRPIQC